MGSIFGRKGISTPKYGRSKAKESEKRTVNSHAVIENITHFCMTPLYTLE